MASKIQICILSTPINLYLIINFSKIDVLVFLVTWLVTCDLRLIYMNKKNSIDTNSTIKVSKIWREKRIFNKNNHKISSSWNQNKIKTFFLTRKIGDNYLNQFLNILANCHPKYIYLWSHIYFLVLNKHAVVLEPCREKVCYKQPIYTTNSSTPTNQDWHHRT